jgi:hypothetical protein
LQVTEDFQKVLKKMAGDILFGTIGVQGAFGEDKIRLLSRTPVGKAVSYKKDRIIFLSIDLNEPLFASPTETALSL